MMQEHTKPADRISLVPAQDVLNEARSLLAAVQMAAHDLDEHQSGAICTVVDAALDKIGIAFEVLQKRIDAERGWSLDEHLEKLRAEMESAS